MDDTVSGILAGRGTAPPEDRRLVRAYSSNPDIASLHAAAAAAAQGPAPPAPAAGSSPDSFSGAPNVAAAAAAAASAIAAVVSAVAGTAPGRSAPPGDAAAPTPSQACEEAGGEAAPFSVESGPLTVPPPPGLSAEEQSRRLLLCRERHEFLCSVEESPGMPWPRAKFQAR